MSGKTINKASKIGTVTIKKGPYFNIQFPKSQMKSIKNIGDGVSFILVNGVEINCIDQNLPSSTKQVLETSMNRFYKDEKNLVYDLLDYSKPLQIFSI